MELFAPIPSVVESCSHEALEWARLLDLVASFAHSTVAGDWLRGLQPSQDLPWIQEQHELVVEVQAALAAGLSPGVGGLFDPRDLLLRAHIGGAALEGEEILALLRLLDDIAGWQASLKSAPESAGPMDRLRELSRLPEEANLAGLARSLRSRFHPDGTLNDDASPELRRIRREIARQRRSIEESLRSTLRRLSQGGEAQDELITIRGERFVIPIKAEHKRRIPGVVHGASSSGQTVFLEPLETIEQNNELRRLNEDELAEIQRIFAAMTREIGQQADAIGQGAAVLARVDSLAARARFAKEFECVRPSFSSCEAPALQLERARHPLLEKRLRLAGAEPVVPLSLALRDGERQLVISGPNTGGKTVALKTTGLLAIMAQAGIPVPASAAVFPLFHAFLADIGDAQSLERNLSTFSAHIAQLQSILDLVDAASPTQPVLVLLDELGSATEPEEGAALAVAIAGHLLDRRAWTLISTHQTPLKIYAAKRAGVLNAAVGFDERTLTPTYDLRLGVPGASAGINIAQRLGLNPAIVANARSALASGTQEIAGFLSQLHEQLATAAGERAALAAQSQELAREKRRLDAEGLKEWRAKARDLELQLELLLKDFTFRLHEAVRAVEDRTARQKLLNDADRRMARLKREFSEQFNATVVAQHSGADKGDRNAAPHLVQRVAVGDTIHLKSLGKAGVVRRQIDRDLFEVAVGQLKMRVPREDIASVASAPSVVAASPLDAARRRGISVSLAAEESPARAEINVIGRTVDEAEGEVEQFLDRAFLAGLPRVRVVHGVGTGRLRSSLRALLRRHPHVALVAEASPSEGGAGATVVDLRP